MRKSDLRKLKTIDYDENIPLLDCLQVFTTGAKNDEYNKFIIVGIASESKFKKIISERADIIVFPKFDELRIDSYITNVINIYLNCSNKRIKVDNKDCFSWTFRFKIADAPNRED